MKLPVDRPLTAGDVIRFALASSVDRLLRHERGVLAGRDAEAVHQARVAVRRIRSDLRTFRALVNPRWNAKFRQELGWLGDELGAVRDLDVFLVRIQADLARRQESAAAARLKAAVRAERTQARKKLLAALQSDRYRALRNELRNAAGEAKLSRSALLPAASALRPLVAASYHRLRADVFEALRRPQPAALHAIRISAKRMRYAAEAAAVDVGKPALRLAGAAARVQDVLGEHHDALEAVARLRKMRREPGLARTVDALSRAERACAARARSEWPPAWQSLDKKRLRLWF